MLLGLRSLWEETPSGVVTGTMAVTAARGTCAAAGTQSAVPEEERLQVGGKKVKEPRPPRIARWDEFMPPAPLPKEPPIVFTGVAVCTSPKARSASFARMLFPARQSVLQASGRVKARGILNTDAVDRDEAFEQFLLAA